jgi:hypothetical protein
VHSLTTGVALVVAMMAAASPVETPGKGSPLRRANLDGLRATRPLQELSRAWHAKVSLPMSIFEGAAIGGLGFRYTISETDSTNKTESFSGVMRMSQGQWAMVEFLSDSIPSAGHPAKEFRSWRTQFMGNIRNVRRRFSPLHRSFKTTVRAEVSAAHTML